MEIVCLNYLKECNYPLVKIYRELFEDPVRNGTLMMLVVCRRFGCKAEFHTKPKNIDDCRENYYTASEIIREQLPNFPNAYTESTELIIRGEKNLFYGMVYTLLKMTEEGGSSNRRPMLDTECKRSCSFEEYPAPASLRATIMGWLTEKNLRIKHYHQVEAGVKTGLLVFELVSGLIGKDLKAVHEQPQYQFQCEANLNKAIQYLNEHTGQASKYTWKVNKLVAGDESVVLGFLDEIRRYEPKPRESLPLPLRPQSISFNQLLRSQQTSTHNQNYNTLNFSNTFENAQANNSVSKPLETTMAGHLYSSNPATSTHRE